MDQHAPDGSPELDDERPVDETELDDALPDVLDAPFEEPLADVIDQRREVPVDDDYRV